MNKAMDLVFKCFLQIIKLQQRDQMKGFYYGFRTRIGERYRGSHIGQFP